MKFYDNGIYEDFYKVNFMHTGFKGEMSNKSFLSIMENLAEAHSAYCHISFSDLKKYDLSWVILNWKLKVFKRPKADETLRVQTWCTGFNKILIYRDFNVFNEKNELCAIATSKWCMVNISLGKMAKLPDDIDKKYHIVYTNKVFDENDIPKILIPNENYVDCDTYKIRRFDIDINKHVHNLNYLNFAMEVLPFDVFIGKELNNVEICYKKEIKYGETIKSFLYVENNPINAKENDTIKETDNKIYTIVIKDEKEETVHSLVKLYN